MTRPAPRVANDPFDPQALLAGDFAPAPIERSLFERLAPTAFWADAPLPAIAHALAEPAVQAELADCEATGAYPERAVDRLQRAGLAELFAGARATVPHGCALSALLARHSGSLAVAIGVSYLGLAPIYAAADDALLAELLDRVRAGAFVSLAMSELASGSNLAGIATYACDDRLWGTKDLINGGTRHELLVVLASTGLYVVPRGPEVTALGRWRTLAVRGADIGSVRFDGAPGRRLGRDGFTTIQQTLVLTRGGIGSFAAGTASGATEMAHAYAQRRTIAQRPIAEHGAIAEHLQRMRALELVANCVAVKACCALNAAGSGAVVASAVAKLAGCDAAERAVTEGRHVLGARALLEAGPYERFVRDVLVFGAFDGTRHVVLEQLAWRLAQLATNGPTGSLAGCYTHAPRPLREVCRARARAVIPQPDLPLTAELLAAVRAARASGAWDRDQALRFALAGIYADLEAVIAVCELADDDRRTAAGLPPAGVPDVRLAVDWLTARCATALREALRGDGGFCSRTAPLPA